MRCYVSYMEPRDVMADLLAEYEAIQGFLDELNDSAASRESSCRGWTVSDVVLHLAQTEEAVVATIKGVTDPLPQIDGASNIDELMQRWVETQRGASFSEVRERWSAARRASWEAIDTADPGSSLLWAATPLKPRTLATTRLSEHWIHAQDIVEPLGIEYPDTERLWHIARLAHRTIPYAFQRAGAGAAPEVRAELRSPSGESWAFGPEDASCRIEGAASEFCRIAARRLNPSASSVVATGKRADDVMALVRTYA